MSMSEVPFVKLKGEAQVQVDRVAPKVASGLPFALLSAVSQPYSDYSFSGSGIVGVVSRMRLRQAHGDVDHVMKVWLLQLVSGPNGTFQWQDFLPTCGTCSVHMSGLFLDNPEQACPVCNARSGTGNCFQFSCNESSPLHFGCGNWLSERPPVYCGSHPFFSGYKVSDGLMEPAKYAIFDVIHVDYVEDFICGLTAGGHPSRRLETNIFIEGQLQTFRAIVTTTEQSIMSKCEVKLGSNFRTVTSCIEIARYWNGEGQHAYILVEQDGLHILRSFDKEPKKWKDRAPVQFPEHAQGFQQQLVKVSETLILGLSKSALWAILVPMLPYGTAALTSAEMASKISCHQILSFECREGNAGEHQEEDDDEDDEDSWLDQRVEKLLALGPASHQVIIFSTDEASRQCIRPCLLIDVCPLPEKVVVGKIRRITSLDYVPFKLHGVDSQMESRPILPHVIRDNSNGGYLFFDRIGQVRCLRDESIIRVEDMWQKPDLSPSPEMRRVVTFNFPGSPESSRMCPLGLLMRYAYFKSLFTDWQEGSAGEVEIKDTDVKTLDCMLQYLFTGDLSSKLDLSLLISLLVLANKYLMTDLLAFVSFKIIYIISDGQRLKEQSALALAELLIFTEVAHSSCPTLKNKVICAILRHKLEVVEDPGFLKVVASGSAEVLAKLLQHARKQIPSEFFSKRRKVQEDSCSFEFEQVVPVWGNAATDSA